MSVFDEFLRLAAKLDQDKVPYALVGGVALAFHGHPRFTEDINILVDTNDVKQMEEILTSLGYFSSAKPWRRSSGLILRRFFKTDSGVDFVIDLLEVVGENHCEAVARARVAEGQYGIVRVATAPDLIALKKKGETQHRIALLLRS